MNSPDREESAERSSSPDLQEYINRFEEREVYEMRISSGKKATYFCKDGENSYRVYTIRKGTGKLEEPLQEADMEDKELFYSVLMLAMKFQPIMAELDEELNQQQWWNEEDDHNYY